MDRLTVTDFINEEHKAYSVVSTIRNMPLIIDGLKPSQRKILFSAMEYGKEEIVDRLAMFSAARTNYKSGGDNMSETIINMAKAYSGTNNIPYFDIDGQFGSIVNPGASSPRYISVKVSDIIRKIFRKEDDEILEYNYLNDEKMEPKFYLPIIPMYLVNGSNGIGTGYATKTPNHSVQSIISAIRSLLKGEDPKPLEPYWKGFKGKCGYNEDGRVFSEGTFERINATTIKITEVPIGFHSKMYEEKVLLPLYVNGTLTDISNDTTEKGWDITITFKRGELSKLSDDSVMSLLKLNSAWLPTMAGWDDDGKVKRFVSINDILVRCFNYRLDRYDDRRISMLAKMQASIDKLEMRSMFIQYMTAADLNQSLDVLKKNFLDEVKIEVNVDELFKIPLSSITLDAKEKLAREINKLKGERTVLLKKTSIDLYSEDLDDLEVALSSK